MKVVQRSVGAHHAHAYFLDLRTRVWKGDRVHAVEAIIRQVRPFVAYEQARDRSNQRKLVGRRRVKRLAHNVSYTVAVLDAVKDDLQKHILYRVRVDSLWRHQRRKRGPLLRIVNRLAPDCRRLNGLRHLGEQVDAPRARRVKGYLDFVARKNVACQVDVAAIAHCHSLRLARPVEPTRPLEQPVVAHIPHKGPLLGLVERGGRKHKPDKAVLQRRARAAHDDSHARGRPVHNGKL